MSESFKVEFDPIDIQRAHLLLTLMWEYDDECGVHNYSTMPNYMTDEEKKERGITGELAMPKTILGRVRRSVINNSDEFRAEILMNGGYSRYFRNSKEAYKWVEDQVNMHLDARDKNQGFVCTSTESFGASTNPLMDEGDRHSDSSRLGFEMYKGEECLAWRFSMPENGQVRDYIFIFGRVKLMESGKWYSRFGLDKTENTFKSSGDAREWLMDKALCCLQSLGYKTTCDKSL